MQRRNFITLLGGAAAAWPLAAHAQPDGRVRRIAVLFGGNDTGRQPNVAALREGLAKLGWIEGRNLATFASMMTMLTRCVASQRRW
jgi:putative ABC transport system substrate-binding protein